VKRPGECPTPQTSYRPVGELQTLGEHKVVTESDACHVDTVWYRGDDNEVMTLLHRIIAQSTGRRHTYNAVAVSDIDLNDKLDSQLQQLTVRRLRHVGSIHVRIGNHIRVENADFCPTRIPRPVGILQLSVLT